MTTLPALSLMDANEHVDEITCADCGDTRLDVKTCEDCTATGCACDVARRDYDCGAPEDGLTLCEEHTPSHRGCNYCDPVMPWEV